MQSWRTWKERLRRRIVFIARAGPDDGAVLDLSGRRQPEANQVVYWIKYRRRLGDL